MGYSSCFQHLREHSLGDFPVLELPDGTAAADYPQHRLGLQTSAPVRDRCLLITADVHRRLWADCHAVPAEDTILGPYTGLSVLQRDVVGHAVLFAQAAADTFFPVNFNVMLIDAFHLLSLTFFNHYSRSNKLCHIGKESRYH